VRKWRREYWIIYRDVVRLFHNRHMFREFTKMVRTNPKLQEPNSFLDSLVENYVAAMAVGIRRQSDRDTRSVSMYLLLEDVARHALVLTRTWYVATYVTGKRREDRRFYAREANATFDRFATRKGSRLSAALVRRDQHRLLRAARRIQHYVNRRVAHRDMRRFSTQLTFRDLHDALDEIGALLQRYSLLLTGGELLQVEPLVQDNWKAVFQEPWILLQSPSTKTLSSPTAP
jgi:hypothetical protein